MATDSELVNAAIEAMNKAALALAKPDANATIAKEILELAKSRQKQ